MSWETLVILGVLAIVITLLYDVWGPSFKGLREGFLVTAGDNPFVSAYFPRRGDIGFNEEEAGYIHDPRHVMGYADVQALGVNHDFCRMVLPKGGSEKQAFFACGLGGTENLSSTAYKTLTVGDGFKMSRDDYMRDTDGNGKSDYCAVIKVPGRGWEARCYRALESGFDTRTTVDTSPPDDIKEMLYFYEGILFWFRFIDDMKDYGEVLDLYTAGGLKIDETEVKPLPSQLLEGSTTSSLEDRIQKTKGLQFDGINQFLRLGDGPDLGFGHKISLPTMRAVCFWVKFEEFTNNAHIVDFGNGAGQDNYFIGIIGKGDTDMGDSAELRPVGCASDAGMVLPTGPSGAQPVPTMTPQELMKTTDANVNEYTRNNWKIDSAKPPKNALNASKRSPGAAPKTATLLFEVWNGKQRLQHIKVQKAIKLKTWTHVCITTATGDGVRPAIQIWVDGSMMAEDPNGYLPQTSFTTNNYLGKSNWINETSKYENKAELFKGSLFDVRAYNQGMPADKIKKTIAWGRKRLA